MKIQVPSKILQNHHKYGVNRALSCYTHHISHVPIKKCAIIPGKIMEHLHKSSKISRKKNENLGPNRAKAHRQGHLMFHPSDDGRGRQVPAHRAEGPFRELLEVVASAFYGKRPYGKHSERFGCHFCCELMV